MERMEKEQGSRGEQGTHTNSSISFEKLCISLVPRICRLLRLQW